MSTYSATQFAKTVEIVGSLPKDGPVKPSQADQLYFYARFKQVNKGDNTTTRPGMMDFAGKAKWDAWTEVKGKSTEEAQSEYVARFLEILDKDASNEENQKLKAAILAA